MIAGSNQYIMARIADERALNAHGDDFSAADKPRAAQIGRLIASVLCTIRGCSTRSGEEIREAKSFGHDDTPRVFHGAKHTRLMSSGRRDRERDAHDLIVFAERELDHGFGLAERHASDLD